MDQHPINVIFITVMLPLLLLLQACTSDNEHFCARYQYLYEQLNDKDLLPYEDLKALLLKDIKAKKSRDKRSEMMLLALEDHHIEIIPPGESPKDFCLRTQRWQH